MPVLLLMPRDVGACTPADSWGTWVPALLLMPGDLGSCTPADVQDVGTCIPADGWRVEEEENKEIGSGREGHKTRDPTQGFGREEQRVSWCHIDRRCSTILWGT